MGIKKGIESLRAAAVKDCEGEDKTKTLQGCTCRCCGCYDWAIARAKHYGERTNTPWEKILESWEEQRDYWYLNYYQECNQPEIKDAKVRIFDTVEDLLKSAGKEFRCPACSGVSKSAYKCTCEKCDWKAYGLFGTMGKGITVFVKDRLVVNEIFMPIAWE